MEASCSTKNSSKSWDPQMAQTKKGNEWYFGMKAHIGADVWAVTVPAGQDANRTMQELRRAGFDSFLPR